MEADPPPVARADPRRRAQRPTLQAARLTDVGGLIRKERDAGERNGEREILGVYALEIFGLPEPGEHVFSTISLPGTADFFEVGVQQFAKTLRTATHRPIVQLLLKRDEMLQKFAREYGDTLLTRNTASEVRITRGETLRIYAGGAGAPASPDRSRIVPGTRVPGTRAAVAKAAYKPPYVSGGIGRVGPKRGG